jgi:hypothetical protein
MGKLPPKLASPWLLGQLGRLLELIQLPYWLVAIEF